MKKKQNEVYPQLEYDNRGRCIGGTFKIKGNKDEPRIYIPKKMANKIDSLVYVKFIDRRIPRFSNVKPDDHLTDDEFGQ